MPRKTRMIRIFFTDETDYRQWQIDDKQSMKDFLGRYRISKVEEVQADGYELVRIMQQFKNLPMHHNEIVHWFGDDAKFIIANLK